MATITPAALAAESRSMDVTCMDASSLMAAYASGALSPVEVASACLARLDEVEPVLNAFVYRDADTTLAMGRASEARWRRGEALGPLDGVPISIKDLVAVEGWPLRRGSRANPADVPCPEDAPCVARLREAGAVFVGKTATPDSGCKIVTISDVHGETANPYDPSRTPGGSSGGAAASLAAGVTPLAVGTDGAGSIRIPAAYCNVVGLKPSFGRVPIHPPSLFMPHSVVGPMGRRVADVALMLSVMAGPDPRDPFALTSPLKPSSAEDGAPKRLRIAFAPTLGCRNPGGDPSSSELVGRAACRLADAGWLVEAAAPAWPVDPLMPFQVFWEATYAGYLATYPEEQQRLMDPDLLAIGERGRRIDILAYHKALGQRLAITAAAKAFFQSFDLLIGPVMPVPPYPLGRLKPNGAAGEWDWCPFTYPWNMTGQPAIAVPCGFTAAGLPVGLQIIAWTGREDLVLRLAAEVERLIPCHQHRPEIQTLPR